MSFILDALKKLEQKRHRGTVPDLLTVHEPVPQETKKRLVWPYLLLVALLLNAGILTLWLGPWRSEKPVIVAQSIDGKQLEPTAIRSSEDVPDTPEPATSRGLAKTVSPAPAADEEESLSGAKTTETSEAVGSVDNVSSNEPENVKADVQKEISSEPAPTVEMTGSPEIFPSTQEQTPTNDLSPTESQTPAESGVESEDGVLNVNELPLSVRQELPQLTIAGHIYSNEPGARMANINGQIIQEGEVVTEGLKLEEITPTEVIFSYRGYLFRKRGF
jgi:general secretion pathway protein B